MYKSGFALLKSISYFTLCFSGISDGRTWPECFLDKKYESRL